MKRTALALCLGLAACGGLPENAARLTPLVVSPGTVATIQTWCTRGAPLIRAARSPMVSAVSTSIAEIAGRVGPYCDAITAGQLPPTTDANTVNWLQQNLSGLGRLIGLTL